MIVWRTCATVLPKPRGAAFADPLAMRFPACPCPEYRYVSRLSGRGAAWLARPSGGRKVASSNLAGPTNTETARLPHGRAGGSVSRAGGA